MAKKKQQNRQNLRDEKEVILEFMNLGRGKKTAEREKLAKELGITLSAMKYRVRKFREGGGLGRKKRSDAGIPKRDVDQKKRLEFFAELAMGTSVDEAAKKCGLTEHQGNKLSKEFKQSDKWYAIRNSPQLDDLRELIQDILRMDIALVDSEMNGAWVIDVKGTKISIPSEELKDLKTILAHCMSRDEMAKLDPKFANMSKDDITNVRVYYLKEFFLEKGNTTDFARLQRATKVSTPERQLDLKIVYALIDKYEPGLDAQSKISIIREIVTKVKNEDE